MNAFRKACEGMLTGICASDPDAVWDRVALLIYVVKER